MRPAKYKQKKNFVLENLLLQANLFFRRIYKQTQSQPVHLAAGVKMGLEMNRSDFMYFWMLGRASKRAKKALILAHLDKDLKSKTRNPSSTS